MTITATQGGKITIPATICQQLGIKDGTRIHIDANEAENRITLTPINRTSIHNLRWKYKGAGLLKALTEDRRREATRL